MSSPCCEPPRIVLERRKSDFAQRGRVTAYTGSGCCCCCCCLHWVGAAVGGAYGLRMGWRSADKKVAGDKLGFTPVHPKMRRAIGIGIGAGIAISIASMMVDGVFASSSSRYAGGLLLSIAVVPSLFFLPVGAMMLLLAFGRRWRLQHAYRRALIAEKTAKEETIYRSPDGARPRTLATLDGFETFCRACWHRLGDSQFAAACPECGAPLEHPAFPEADHGIRTAWRASWLSFSLSTLFGIVSYVLMWLLFIASK